MQASCPIAGASNPSIIRRGDILSFHNSFYSLHNSGHDSYAHICSRKLSRQESSLVSCWTMVVVITLFVLFINIVRRYQAHNSFAWRLMPLKKHAPGIFVKISPTKNETLSHHINKKKETSHFSSFFRHPSFHAEGSTTISRSDTTGL